MTTYYESTRKKQYVAAIMETEDVNSTKDWLARGSEQDKIRENVKDRFAGRSIESLDSLIVATDH